MTALTVITKDTSISIHAPQKTVQIVPQKTTIAIFPNASIIGQGVQTRIKVPFSFGDATPKFIGNVQGLIKNASIIIITPFNVPSNLALGDDLNSARLISHLTNDPMTIAEYEFSPIIQYASPTDIKLTITPGIGCTAGSGFIILEV